MPITAIPFCSFPGGCAVRVHGRCQQHRREQRAATAQHLYSQGNWRVYSRHRLRAYPWCVLCHPHSSSPGSAVMVPATVTDHIIPHKGNVDLFWDESNHQSLCSVCHNVKTATEDGGFGR